MSVYLDIFPGIAVLRISGPLREKQVRVLAAGIRRIFDAGGPEVQGSQGVKSVLIDARDAHLVDDAALEAAIAARETLIEFAAKTPGRLVRIVSPDVRISHFSDLPAALSELQYPDAPKLIEWIKSATEASRLESEQKQLLAEMGTRIQEAKRARGERARVEKLRAGMRVLKERWGKRWAAWSRMATNVDEVEQLNVAKAKLEALKKVRK